MKRYGDNLPSSVDAEAELQNQHGNNIQYMPSGCAVRQDMVAFIMPTDIPIRNKRKAPNFFFSFKLGAKKVEERGS